ncbi:MAG: class A beta-lactamase-related serine hydrolase [Rhodocyclaceae bacterium]|nr:MAG: class A beta-lactamase-related serine hydrolase [Rhodocyclaceae bacterium]
MRDQVDQQFLPCVSTALLRGREVVDTYCYGYADKETRVALREDHIFRAFSNTKLATSSAALLLWEEGRFQLDDPIDQYIPELANRHVLRPNATRIEDTEPARSRITIRQLMTHTSGLSYGIFDPGTVLFAAYNKAAVGSPTKTLQEQVNTLATLPLAFHPGARWEYSRATDVLGRLIEVVSGEGFGTFLARRIFEPLGMVDTDFYVPESKASRFTTLYVGVDIADPTKPGLLRADDKPYPGAYLKRMANESGGGGLVTTLGDTVRLIQSLQADGPTLLKPETIALMGTNQLPTGQWVEFPNIPPMVGRGFGLGSSVAVSPGPLDPEEIASEVSWGGLAGTSWWYNPRLNIAGVLMTQRYFGQGNPFVIAFKQQAYKAFGY